MSDISPSAIGLIVGTATNDAGGTKPTCTLAVACAPTTKPVPASNVTDAVAEPPVVGAVTAAVMVQVAVVAPAAITIGDTHVVL